jgi:hypothetical protein
VNGLDEIDAHRHIAAAIGELLENLDDRQHTRRRDVNRPCCDRSATIDALRQARRLLGDLAAIAGAVGRMARCLDGHVEVCAALGQALDTITDDTALGCTHECPPIPRTPGDRTAIARDLVDLLDSHGYQLARAEQQRWAS